MWQLILSKDLQIVQFLENVNAGLQLDWNGVLNVSLKRVDSFIELIN